jgi:hypothetical protein
MKEITGQSELQSIKRDSSSPLFVAGWTLLIMGGLALQFASRLIGYEGNPTTLYYPPLAAFTGIAAALIILWGYFTITRSKTTKDVALRRRGVLLVIFGAIMLVGFFAFKEVMPLVFAAA